MWDGLGVFSLTFNQFFFWDYLCIEDCRKKIELVSLGNVTRFMQECIVYLGTFLYFLF